MSSKTVKITNGKILNYKISASGYKTIYGSQLITSNTTINKNMIAESDPNGVYSLGDRLGGIASFLGYYSFTNFETDATQTCAVFVVDAQYRGLTTRLLSDESITLSNITAPTYTSWATAIETTVSGTQNIDNMIAAMEGTSYTSPGIELVRNLSLTIDGNTYYGQIPNAKVLKDMFTYKTQLDANDPTATDYPTKTLTTWASGDYVASSSFYYNKKMVWAFNSTSGSVYGFYMQYGIFPVFEIPVN